ncbi:MAG: hypothetical protein QXZ28_06005 [Candidatus Methanomethylicaceae archaeon]
MKKIRKWVMVYGRRKTGKTFLVRNFMDYDEYFFVKKDRTIFVGSTGKDITYDTLKEVLTRMLKDGKTVVVDEFHRLGSDFLDYLHFTERKGRLVLISSTFHLARKILSENSPILGLFAEFQVGLIRLDDVVRKLKKNMGKKELVELSILMREPLVIEYYRKGESPEDIVASVISTSKYTVPALVGEVFNEEEKNLSAVYEGILRAVARGNQVSTEISSYLFSNRLIQKDDPSTIQPYLGNLIKFGLLKRVKIVNRNTYRYMHVSPLIQIFYYGDEKYNLSEIQGDNRFISTIIAELFPRLVESHVREYFSRKYGLTEGIVEERDYEIDGYLMKFKKPEIALEIKWAEKISKDDVVTAMNNLFKVSAKRRILFVPDKRKVKYKPDGIEIVDVLDIV